MVGVLRQLRLAISAYDSQIEKLARAHPDFAIFDSFPGAGAALAPRLIAALGTHRDRYRTAHEFSVIAALLRLSKAVVSSTGFTTVDLALSSCGKPFMSGHYIPSLVRLGLKTTTGSIAPMVNPIILPFEHRRLNGSAFCSDAGKTGRSMTRRCMERPSPVRSATTAVQL